MDAASFREFASSNSAAFRDAVEQALNENGTTLNHLVILKTGGGLYVLLFFMEK
ncbi:pore-forming tail tip protein [Klebsiella phage vB_Kpn_3]|nr:pore-forming tail tip protein [Klebsiella phage vB_Kpn_3]